MKKAGRGQGQINLGQPTLVEACSWYVTNVVALKKPSTAKTYRWITEWWPKVLSPYPDAAELMEKRAELLEAKAAGAETLNMRVRILSRALRLARRKWPLLVDFTEEVPYLAEGVRRPRGLADPTRTFPVLCQAMPDVRARLFLRVQREYGLRVGEARGLQPGDFDFTAGTMAVMRQRAEDRKVPTSLKYDTCAATMPVGVALLEDVREVFRLRMREKRRASEVYRDFLFPYYRREQDELMGICRQVSPADFSLRVVGEHGGDAWHVFRHTFGTEAVDRFHLHPEKVKALMRHKQLSSTQGYIASMRGGYFDFSPLRELTAMREEDEKSRSMVDLGRVEKGPESVSRVEGLLPLKR